MADLLARLQADLTAARRAQDKAQLLVLGSIVSDAKNREIELKRDLTDEDVTEVLRRGIKRRRESLDMYEKGAREDLASIERGEVELLGKYLPAAVDPDVIRAAVVAAIDARLQLDDSDARRANASAGSGRRANLGSRWPTAKLNSSRRLPVA